MLGTFSGRLQGFVGGSAVEPYHPGSINGVRPTLPQALPDDCVMCLQGQARDSGRQWTPWSSSQPEEKLPRTQSGALIQPVGIFKNFPERDSDVMNINNKPLIVFMTGPWEWGLEKMRLKGPAGVSWKV